MKVNTTFNADIAGGNDMLELSTGGDFGGFVEPLGRDGGAAMAPGE